MVTRGLYFDSATLYYRAFFAVPESVKAPDGTPSGAVRGFLDMVSTLITQFPADYVVFAWDDDWRPQWRVDLIPSYKTHRLEPDTRMVGTGTEDVPDDLSPQITAIAQIIDAIGVPRLGEVGFEADDILGSLVAQYKHPTDVVTGDRDLFQLVNDSAQTRVLSITKGIKNLAIVDDAYLREKYGVIGSQYADFAALRGDASDGLPGVRGIGEKTASALISHWESIENLMLAVVADGNEVANSARTKLLAHTEDIPKMQKVVRVRTDAKVTKKLKPYSNVKHPEVLAQLATEWGIVRQVNALLRALNLEQLDSVKT
jgi:5'-3' exonuclease